MAHQALAKLVVEQLQVVASLFNHGNHGSEELPQPTQPWLGYPTLRTWVCTTCTGQYICSRHRDSDPDKCACSHTHVHFRIARRCVSGSGVTHLNPLLAISFTNT